MAPIEDKIKGVQSKVLWHVIRKPEEPLHELPAEV